MKNTTHNKLISGGVTLGVTESYDKGVLPGLSRTILANSGTAGVALENGVIRKLTPRECWRLMDWSDEDFDKAKATGLSDNQLYRIAGNGCVLAVVEAVFSTMLE